jgi:putrescine transport system substrate-binding protein
VANEPSIFPGPEDMKRMGLPEELSSDSRRAMSRIFTSFKTGL